MKRMSRLAAGLTLAIAAGVMAAAPEKNAAALPRDLARQLNQAFIEVADKVSPSVVVVKVARKTAPENLGEGEHPFWDMLPREFRRRFEAPRPKRKSEEPVFDGQGSGVVIREDGYILTNFHVVEEAAKVKVKFQDGKEYEATVTGTDAQSDLAVLKIAATGLPAAPFGDSSATRVGEFAIAIGAPYELEYSLTVGHVSAKGRSRVIPDPAMDQDFIQTDANINPGNSGGPLVNINGEIIGINTLIRGLNTGIGFAIPSNLAREVADQLIRHGKFTRSWLGVAITSLREDPEYRNLVKGVKDGVVVKEIVPDGPAAKSDLKPSDIITAVEGRPVATSQQLRNEVRSKKIGEAITLDVFRKDRLIKVKVKPEAWPDEENKLAQGKPGPAPDASPKTLGLTVQTLTPELAKKHGVKETAGLIVTDVDLGSPAEEKGLKIGDVITEIDHQPVKNVREFQDALKKADRAKGVVVNLNSQGTSKFVVLKE